MHIGESGIQRTAGLKPLTVAQILLLSGGMCAVLMVMGAAPWASLMVLGFAGLILVVGFLKNRLAPLYMSPVFIAAFSIIAMGILGDAFYRSIQDAPGGGGAIVHLSEGETIATLQVLLVAAGCIFVAGLTVVYMIPPISGGVRPDFPMSQSALRWLLFGSIVPLVVILVLAGPEKFRRAYYIERAVNDSGVLGIMDQLSVVAVIALGFILALARRGSAKWWVSALGAFGYFVIFFGAGSRKLAIFPILLAVGLLVGRRSKGTVLLLAASMPLAFYLIRVALYLRGLSEHGVLPYIASLDGIRQYAVGWDTIAKNLLISFGIIGATAFQASPIGSEAFWIAMNPLPGRMTGWYDIAPAMRINVYTPFAGLGELANFGAGYLIGYCLTVGVILGILDLQVQRLLKGGLPFFGLASVGLTGLFVLYMVQYNLRSATRMLLYAMLMGVAVEVILWFRRRATGSVESNPKYVGVRARR